MQLKTLQKGLAIAGIGAVTATLVLSGQFSIYKADYEFWNLPRWNAEIQEMDESSEQLSMESTVVAGRIVAKETVIHDLVDGRVSLADAMERFRELNAGHEELHSMLEFRFPQQDEDERLYHNILDFVFVQIKDQPDCRAVQARLAYEWQQLHRQRTRLN
ncbi:MAG TPA: hypothetical protein VKS79_05215 [Gemmataceae bacterium]|nr:hypothetical protein [Gemmataceae bacterium]